MFCSGTGESLITQIHSTLSHHPAKSV